MSAEHEDDRPAHHLEYLYEPGLVWASQVQKPGALTGDPGELGAGLFEYCFQVPANRIGSDEWTVPQLKVLQECSTLVVFTLVAFALFRSPLKWNILVAYGFIVGAVFFAFKF